MSLCHREQRQLRDIEAGLFRSDYHRSGAPASGHRPPGLALEPDEAVRADLHAGQLLFSLRANQTWPMLLTAR